MLNFSKKKGMFLYRRKSHIKGPDTLPRRDINGLWTHLKHWMHCGGRMSAAYRYTGCVSLTVVIEPCGGTLKLLLWICFTVTMFIQIDAFLLEKCALLTRQCKKIPAMPGSTEVCASNCQAVGCWSNSHGLDHGTVVVDESTPFPKKKTLLQSCAIIDDVT